MPTSVKDLAMLSAAVLAVSLTGVPDAAPLAMHRTQRPDTFTVIALAVQVRHYALRDSLPIDICDVPRILGRDSAAVFSVLTPDRIKAAVLPCSPRYTGPRLNISGFQVRSDLTSVDLQAFENATVWRSETADRSNASGYGVGYSIRLALTDSDTVRFRQYPLLAFDYAIKLRRALLGDSAAVNLCDLPRHLGVDSATVFATLTQERIGAEVRPCPSGPSGRPQLWAEQVWNGPGVTKIVLLYSDGVARRSEYLEYGSAVSFDRYIARYTIGGSWMVD